MTLRYEVTYYIGDRRQPDHDSDVPESYLADLPGKLRPGETAFARCLSDPGENREIDQYGVRRTT